MPYARITILLRNGTRRTGVRHFPEPMNLEDIRTQAWQLSAEVLGRGVIENVVVAEVPADDPAVVALILEQQLKQKAATGDSSRADYLRQRRGQR
jgi:hypothetical protein